MSMSSRLRECNARLDKAAELQTEFSRLQMLANAAPSISSFRKANTAAIELSAHITGILAHLINGHIPPRVHNGGMTDNFGKIVQFPMLGDPNIGELNHDPIPPPLVS